MTVPQLIDDFDARLALRATGVLAAFNTAGVLTAADVHVANTLGRLSGEGDAQVQLAVALAVRAVRGGSVCIDLSCVRDLASADARGEASDGTEPLPWPADVDAWRDAVRHSPMVGVEPGGAADRAVRLVGDLLYLDRYWRQEELVRGELAARAAAPQRPLDLGLLRSTARRLFPGVSPDHQRLAAVASAVGAWTIVAGGPGTGKTTTVARMVALMNEVWPTPPRVALAAPTGKAAARLTEAVAAEDAWLRDHGLPAPGELQASTVHRLLGWRPGSRTRFRHDRNNRLPYDVVVVDETSMVSLTLMSRLLEAVRPDAALVLVGDPDQLASVEAGAVLGDLVRRPARSGPDERLTLLADLLPDDLAPADEDSVELRKDVVRLRRVHRFEPDSPIARLADAVRDGEEDQAVQVLSSGAAGVEWLAEADMEQRLLSGVEGLRDDVVTAGTAVHDAATQGSGAEAVKALEKHRLLCAHRTGPYGVRRWSRQVERWLAEEIGGYGDAGEWYLGRPLIVTANDYELHLFNGDTGVVIEETGVGTRAAFGQGDYLVPTNRLADVETVHAMTVHRGQGSQFERVTVILPPPDSPLLTRELLYTAVTRAQSFVRVIGSEESVREAVRRQIQRASGLREG